LETNERTEKNGMHSELEVFQNIANEISSLSKESQQKLIKMIITFFDIKIENSVQVAKPVLDVIKSDTGQQIKTPTFSEDRNMTPKEFIFYKMPNTDVDRVTCLAYYLTHYRNAPFFKTIDISKLNTEAAQLKFSNPTVAVDNAYKAGFLATAEKGQKQISSLGELYVSALPDLEEARNVTKSFRPRRKSKKILKDEKKE
jgi:hypothetical protein